MMEGGRPVPRRPTTRDFPIWKGPTGLPPAGLVRWWTRALLLGGAFSLAALTTPHAGACQAILNVESLQGREVEGFQAELSGDLSLAEGNTEVVQIGASLGASFETERHWLRAFAGLNRLTKGGEEILDREHFHLRYNLLLSQTIRTFHFFQLQSAQNLFLKRRVLLGSGVRMCVARGEETSLEVGTGVMLEMERLDPDRLPPGADPDDDVFRLANLLVGSGPLGQESRWTAVIYHQPLLSSFEDYRLLGEMGLSVKVTRFLDLNVAFNWRHDNKAPEGLKEDDLGLKTGFTLRIR
jgi:putative salt-induced outer membrane protein YdiY